MPPLRRIACSSLLLPVFGLVGIVLAQLPAATSAKPDRYAKEAAVVEHLDTVYHYAADGTGTKQVTMALRIQSEAALRQFGVVTIAYASAYEHIEFDYVRVRRADGTVIETPVADALDMPAEVTRQAPFYSDLKEKQLPVRSLRTGDTIEYQAREIRSKAECLGQLWGSESLATNLVVLEQSIELHLPANKEVNVWSPKVKPAITEKNGERIYRWTGSHLEPTAGPEAEAKKETDKTRFVGKEESDDLQFGEFPSIAWTSFKSWDEVGSWYRSLETDRIVPDADVKSKVAELIAGKTTDEDKVRALYNYVATNIRYIGVALGVGRYQPHLASEVLSNQYGDCKDKHTLLAAMLTQAGFKPSAVLIGAGIRFNAAVPSPAAFNHLITQLPLGSQTVWLDTTQEVAPYRALLSVIRDKDALVIPPSGDARIEKTPAQLPYPSFQHFEVDGALSSAGVAESHVVITARGDDEIVLRAVLHQFSPGQYEDFIQKFSQGLGFEGTTSHAEISRPESTEEPFRIAYDYKREKPGDWENFRITPQVPPLGIATVDEKDPPKIPIDLGAPRVQSVTAVLKLPDGWGATLPDAVHVKTAFAIYDKTYRFEKGTLYCERTLEILKPELPASEWKSFKKFYDDASVATEPWVQLTSSGKRSSGIAPPAPSVNNMDAAGLVYKANNEITARNFDDAAADLERAKKLNDKQAYLWSTYAYLSSSQGNLSDAIVSYRKELSLHPDRIALYGDIATAQLGLGRRKDAEATLRTRLSEDGADEPTSLRLASLLAEDEDYAAAVKVMEAARDVRPGNPRTRLQLARMHIKAGRLPEGRAELVSLIKDSDDANILNDAAYELADANVEFGLAETAVRDALNQLAAQSVSATPDDDPKTSLPRTRLILASWDTLGWILFREHKLAEAEPWVHAAWMLGGHSEVGLHLGQIQEARGDIDAAFTTYSIAEHNTVKYGIDGVKQPPSPRDRELTSRIATLRAKGAKTPAKYDDHVDVEIKTTVKEGKTETSRVESERAFDPVRAGQEIRTFKLDNPNGASGSRMFFVVLSASGVAAKGHDAPAPFKGDDTIVNSLDTKTWWPGKSPVKLFIGGILNCHTATCEFTYNPI